MLDWLNSCAPSTVTTQRDFWDWAGSRHWILHFFPPLPHHLCDTGTVSDSSRCFDPKKAGWMRWLSDCQLVLNTQTSNVCVCVRVYICVCVCVVQLEFRPDPLHCARRTQRKLKHGLRYPILLFFSTVTSDDCKHRNTKKRDCFKTLPRARVQSQIAFVCVTTQLRH